MAHPVSAADHEALLLDLGRSLRSPQDGIYGPDSISWKVNRESALFLAAGRAALLQLAHPWVAAAIAQHSRTLDHPVRRFHGTFRVIFSMMFGSADQAFTAARQLYRLHQRIRGTLPDDAGRFVRGAAYEANELAALSWVYATLVDSGLVAYELLLPPLSADQREQYVLESHRMAALFGIPPGTLPQSWSAFREYFDSTVQSDLLGVSAGTRTLARKLQAGAGLLLRPPFWYQALTVKLLPQPVRDHFQLPFGTQHDNASHRALRILRRIYPKLAPAVRFVGPYNEAVCRLGGNKPGFGVRLSNRIWTGQPTLLVPPRN